MMVVLVAGLFLSRCLLLDQSRMGRRCVCCFGDFGSVMPGGYACLKPEVDSAEPLVGDPVEEEKEETWEETRLVSRPPREWLLVLGVQC